MTAPTTTINGALCRLRDDASLEYQPRVGADLKWYVSMVDNFYDGWSGETIWAESKDAALNEARSRFPRAAFPQNPVSPDYDRNPIAAGWSPEDLIKATIWGGQEIATRNIARRFAAKKMAAE